MGARGLGARPKAEIEAAAFAALENDREEPAWDLPGLKRDARVIAFLESLPITKGRLIGTRMKLLPQQKKFVRALYGAGRDEVQLGVYSEPRGNGKTGMVAGLVLCHLLGPEAEPRGECYSGAIDRQQAGLIFNEMEAILNAMPVLRARVNFQRWHKKIEVLEGPGEGSIYEALSADARRAHGLAPSFWAYDELAQAKDRVLLDNLQTAMGKRIRSLGIVISTQAESDDHPLSQLIDDGLSGIDSSIVVHLIAAPKDADPFALDTIKKANPAAGTFLDLKSIVKEAERARRIPAFESAFRRMRLNQRIALSGHDYFLSPEQWALGNKPINPDIFRDGRPVFAGLDLSARIDLSAFVLACKNDEGFIELMPFAWTPAATIEQRKHSDFAPYDAWVRQGLVFAPPGNSISYDFVAADIMRITQGMNLVALAYDRWGIKTMQDAFARIEAIFPLVEFGQGTKSMGPAVRDVEALAVDGKIVHGGHPVLKWCIGNTVTAKDAAGWRKPDKARATGRIDLAVAALMAVKTLEDAGDTTVDISTVLG